MIIFNSARILVVENVTFGTNIIHVMVRVNDDCPQQENYSVLVTTGIKNDNDDTCSELKNSSSALVSPGEIANFSIQTDSDSQGNRCYNVRVNGIIGECYDILQTDFTCSLNLKRSLSLKHRGI